MGGELNTTKDWFGTQTLATKYAIVFGSALFIVLCAGFIKLLFDRRKMKKFVKQQDLEAGKSEGDELGLNMREKDEGDLFGIRAIEAGFYGGVAQSAPTSRAPSPVGSRSASPAPGPRTDQRNPSASSSVLSLNQFPRSSAQPEVAQPSRGLTFHQNGSGVEVHNPHGSTTGYNNSPRLQPSMAELTGRINHHLPTHDTPPSPRASSRYSRSSEYFRYSLAPQLPSLMPTLPESPRSSFGSSHMTPHDHVRSSYGSIPSQGMYQRMSQSSEYLRSSSAPQQSLPMYTSQAHDRPQYPSFIAETPSMRNSQTSEYLLNQPWPQPSQPDMTPTEYQPYHPSYSPRDRTQNQNHQDQKAQDDLSRFSRETTASSMYAFHSDAAVLDRVESETVGKSAADVYVRVNPHSDDKSQRGSIVSRATTNDARLSVPLSSAIPPVPSITMPAFPKKAIVDSSSPLFENFVKERANKVQASRARSPAPPTAYEQRNRSGSNATTVTQGSRRQNPDFLDVTTNRTKSTKSRRTSFSFEPTIPDFYEAPPRPPPSRPRIGDTPMSSLTASRLNGGVYVPSGYVKGTYMPSGTPF